MASGNGAHGALALGIPAQVNRDLLERHQRTTSDTYWRAVALFGGLFLLGIIGFLIRLSDGFSDKAVWGYYAAVFAFILTTAQAAPLVAIAPRIAKGHWRRPISRAAELWSVVGLFNLLLFIPLLWVLPSLEDTRRTFWFFDALRTRRFSQVPVFSPHIWATLALVGLVVTGFMLLWVSALPDLAAVRDSSSGWRQRWAARLAPNWQGTSEQWNFLYHRTGILGAFYFIMLIFVHFLISVDFAMALVPGWIDALFPITHAANSLQAGAATHAANDVLPSAVRRVQGVHRSGPVLGIGQAHVRPLPAMVLVLVLQLHRAVVRQEAQRAGGPSADDGGPLPACLHGCIRAQLRRPSLHDDLEPAAQEYLGADAHRDVNTHRHPIRPH